MISGSVATLSSASLVLSISNPGDTGWGTLYAGMASRYWPRRQRSPSVCRQRGPRSLLDSPSPRYHRFEKGVWNCVGFSPGSEKQFVVLFVEADKKRAMHLS